MPLPGTLPKVRSCPPPQFEMVLFGEQYSPQKHPKLGRAVSIKAPALIAFRVFQA